MMGTVALCTFTVGGPPLTHLYYTKGDEFILHGRQYRVAVNMDASGELVPFPRTE